MNSEAKIIVAVVPVIVAVIGLSQNLVTIEYVEITGV